MGFSQKGREPHEESLRKHHRLYVSGSAELVQQLSADAVLMSVTVNGNKNSHKRHSAPRVGFVHSCRWDVWVQELDYRTQTELFWAVGLVVMATGAEFRKRFCLIPTVKLRLIWCQFLSSHCSGSTNTSCKC